MPIKRHRQTRRSVNISAIDLFCGAGGLTRGLEKAGIDVKLGVDNDPACEYPFEENNTAKFRLVDVEELPARDLKKIYPENAIKLLAGCAPCQTFSTYNQKANHLDKRWGLLSHFSRLVKEIKPELVTMENVPGLAKQRIFKRFLSDLKKAKYEVSYQVVNCVDYGLPQERKRLVLLASQLGRIELLKPLHRKNSKAVRDVIKGMPRLRAGGCDKRDRLHICSILSETNLQRIKQSRPGGTWREWNEELIAKCHKKKKGKTYSGVYGRMRWDAPSPTITTQFYGFGNGRFGHPRQNRAISLREGALLQSFPRSYKFVEPKKPVHIKTMGRLIGNAVPIKLGEAIGRTLLKHATESRAVSRNGNSNGRKHRDSR